jgi:hypothetical protein
LKTLLASLVALGTLAALSPAALAQEADRPVARFSATGLFAPLVLPSAGLRLSYRLPVADDRIDVFAGWDPANFNLTLSPPKMLHLGGRYYFTTQGPWQTFALASAGIEYITSMPAPAGSAVAVVDTFQISGPVVAAGVGTDWMPTRNVGLTGAVTGYYPYYARLELGVKLAI